jgi:HEAT repeat protein
MPHDDETAEMARLIAIVTGERVVWREREAAVERLVALGKPAVVPLIQALEQDHAGVLMRALGRLGDARAVEPLLAALCQVNPHVRQDAATALGLIGDPRAIGPLIDAFRLESGDTEDITAWQDAAQALARLGAPAVEPLIRALRDENSTVRAWSAHALGQMGIPQAVGPLIAALADADLQVRSDASVALGKIGDASAAEALVARLSDPQENELVRMDAARALGNVVTGAVFAPLAAALDDPAIEVRCQALWALAESAGPRAVDLLLARITDPEACIRHAAVHALAGVGDENLIPLLERIEHQDQGRCRAVLVRETAHYAIECIKKRHHIPPT